MKEFMTGILKIKNNNRFDSLIPFNDSLKSRTKIIYILLFVLLSITIALIPHQQPINKDDQQIGVDTAQYVDWINNLIQSNDIPEFIRQAFVIQNFGDRPLALIFLFTIVNIVKIVNANFYYIIEYVPLVLGPALILAIYFLTRELTSNDITSLIASFLTAVSFHTLIGMYAGFYANWLALIIGYLSFVFLIRFLKKPSKLNLIVYSMLIVLLLFAHVYTWTVLATVMGIYLVVLLKFNYYSRKSIILLLLVISSSVVIDVARMTITDSSSGIVNDIAVASTGRAGLEQYYVRWANLIDVTQIHLAGQFSNFLLFILGLYWLICCNLRQPSNILIAIFLSVGVIPLFFGDWIMQTRVFYDIPFQIPAAIALTYVKKQTNGTMIVLPICIWLIALSIRTVSNFYLILPS
jgi:asparagine N-glycosylation enzyme membrane subunit Stt3